MKTLFAICMSVMAGLAVAQTDYYTGRQTFVVNGQTYRITNRDYSLWIYNSKNTRDVSAPVLDSQGNPMNPNAFQAYYLVWPVKDGSVERAFRETFTEAEINDFKSSEEEIWILYTVNPSGKAYEVTIRMLKHPKLLAIKPEKLYLLEQKLKQYVTFTIREENRQSPFLRSMTFMEFKDLAVDTQ